MHKNVSFTYFLGSLEAKVRKSVNQLDALNIIPRIWDYDYTVWDNSPDEIINRLGWLNSPHIMLENIDRITSFVADIKENNFKHIVLLGMGGSSLAPEVFQKTFGSKKGYPNLHIIDTTDPDAILTIENQIDLDETLFIVSSKSGGTVETLSLLKYFFNKLKFKNIVNHPGEHFIAITDPNSNLVQIGNVYGFRYIFENDSNIGGRFSALSYFGLIPAALLGIDIKKILQNAVSIVDKLKSTSDNWSGGVGTILAEAALAGRDKATFFISQPLGSFGDWVEQLIAESTGKEGRGILPIIDEIPDASISFSNDRIFIFIDTNGKEFPEELFNNLRTNDHPIIQIKINNNYDLAQLFYVWEFAIAVAGHILRINPFSQPNVELAKQKTRNLIAEYVSSNKTPKSQSSDFDLKILDDFLSTIKPGDYIAILAYINSQFELMEKLKDLRSLITIKTGLATTLGIGPRYLHSTGQLHKGDKGNGHFILISSNSAQDLEIPTEIGIQESAISFNALKYFQAKGDFEALLNSNPPRSIIRFHSVYENLQENIEKFFF